MQEPFIWNTRAKSRGHCTAISVNNYAKGNKESPSSYCRDLRRLQEYRLLNRVNSLTAESSSSKRSSSGGLGMQLMETADERIQDIPPPAGIELFDLSAAWPPLQPNRFSSANFSI
jgi:hypothetical protein